MTGYEFGIKELDNLIGGIRGGTNIMLIGPPMCGKDELIHHLLCNVLAANNAAVFVSTREPGNNVMDKFEQCPNKVSTNLLGVVDCVTKTLGMGATDSENVKMASSPVDLTGIGVKISQFFEKFWMKEQVRDTWLCINSLSTILMYSNIQTVFRFLHVFTGRIKAANAIGLYVIEDGMHDEKTITTLKQLFEGAIEIVEENNGHRLRIIGLTPRPTPWFEFVIDGNELTLLECE